MEKKSHIEKKLQRGMGMSLAARTRLQEELRGRQWWVRCWNCKEVTEGTIADLQGTCPNCGVKLRERVGGKKLHGTRVLEENQPVGHGGDEAKIIRKSPPQYDFRGKMVRPDRPGETRRK